MHPLNGDIEPAMPGYGAGRSAVGKMQASRERSNMKFCIVSFVKSIIEGVFSF